MSCTSQQEFSTYRKRTYSQDISASSEELSATAEELAAKIENMNNPMKNIASEYMQD